jgi:hypothetical protein
MAALESFRGKWGVYGVLKKFSKPRKKPLRFVLKWFILFV